MMYRMTDIRHRRTLHAGAIALVLCMAGISPVTGETAAQGSDKSVMKGLMDGNRRFVQGTAAVKDTGKARRVELLKGQHPVATVLTCSDSRVPPEIIFNQGLGKIFIVRVAGNVLDDVTIGSIEYGVEHLHTPLLIILGHTKCGAVKATLEMKGEPEGSIGAIVKKILPAVERAKAAGGTPEQIMNRAIEQNVANVKSELMKESGVVRELVSHGTLSVVTALYRLETGEVTVLTK